MTLTNAPANALRGVTNAPANAPANAHANDANALRTRPPIPPMAFVPRARPLAPLVPLAFGHGCAIAPLASKRSDHLKKIGADREPNSNPTVQKDGIDLISLMRMLIFNAKPLVPSPANPFPGLQRESWIRWRRSEAAEQRPARRRISSLPCPHCFDHCRSRRSIARICCVLCRVSMAELGFGKIMGTPPKGFPRALSQDLQHSWKERRAREAPHQAPNGRRNAALAK
jgi:hypothetical protein